MECHLSDSSCLFLCVYSECTWLWPAPLSPFLANMNPRNLTVIQEQHVEGSPMETRRDGIYLWAAIHLGETEAAWRSFFLDAWHSHSRWHPRASRACALWRSLLGPYPPPIPDLVLVCFPRLELTTTGWAKQGKKKDLFSTQLWRRQVKELTWWGSVSWWGPSADLEIAQGFPVCDTLAALALPEPLMRSWDSTHVPSSGRSYLLTWDFRESRHLQRWTFCGIFRDEGVNFVTMWWLCESWVHFHDNIAKLSST